MTVMAVLVPVLYALGFAVIIEALGLVIVVVSGRGIDTLTGVDPTILLATATALDMQSTRAPSEDTLRVCREACSCCPSTDWNRCDWQA